MAKGANEISRGMGQSLGLPGEAESLFWKLAEYVSQNGTTKEKIAFFGVTAGLASVLVAMRLGYSFDGDLRNLKFSFKAPTSKKA